MHPTTCPHSDGASLAGLSMTRSSTLEPSSNLCVKLKDTSFTAPAALRSAPLANSLDSSSACTLSMLTIDVIADGTIRIATPGRSPLKLPGLAADAAELDEAERARCAGVGAEDDDPRTAPTEADGREDGIGLEMDDEPDGRGCLCGCLAFSFSSSMRLFLCLNCSSSVFSTLNLSVDGATSTDVRVRTVTSRCVIAATRSRSYRMNGFASVNVVLRSLRSRLSSFSRAPALALLAFSLPLSLSSRLRLPGASPSPPPPSAPSLPSAASPLAGFLSASVSTSGASSISAPASSAPPSAAAAAAAAAATS
mmetsp:Transcript_25052/g.63775  ORF Transcript_25052/g.63775 Transcript_25052/m.63775 type:complete len:309 (-) Transcript_25052:239-1165(-)